MSLITKMQRRLRKEESGFTLIELLIVLVIIGILLAIAIPSYLGFKTRAEKSAASSNVRAAIPAAEAYYSDHGNYDFNLTPAGAAAATPLAALRAIDQGIPNSTTATDGWTTITAGTSSYTLAYTKGTCVATVNGPGGSVVVSGC